jgi:hypothetical protein
LNPQILQRDGWEEALRLKACKKWLRTLAQPLETATFNGIRLGVFIPLKGEN